MSDRESILEALAAEMAAALERDGGASAVSLMQHFGALPMPGAGGAQRPPQQRPGAIGVWEPRGPEAPGFYDRSPARREEWHLWADIPTLAPKGEGKRVVLLGESAAYGFFYAPAYTPAKVLASLLGGAAGGAVEVLDLARSSIGTELAEVAAGALALRPDAYVIFAGNNWWNAPLPPPNSLERSLGALALRAGGVKGYKELREQQLALGIAAPVREQLRRLAAAVPIVLVVPEFNLGDWRLDVEQDAPWLPGDGNRRWLELREAARGALAAGEAGRARELARQMMALDGGTAAAGWAILAAAERALGDLAAARAGLERARDAHVWQFNRTLPRVHAIVQEALRGAAVPGRVAVVDLPRLFADHKGGELPDRELFLDFCHLSSAGIRLAMAAVARELSPLLYGVGAAPAAAAGELAAGAPEPTPRIEAEARFAAAIFNAQTGGASEVVSYFCRDALRRSPDIAATMGDFLESQAQRLPFWASPEVARACSAVSTVQLQNLLLPGMRRRLGSPILLPAIAAALEGEGRPARSRLDELLGAEQGVGDEPRDLIADWGGATYQDEDWLFEEAHFVQAHAPASRFPWVSRAAEPVAFELTCRRTAKGSGACQVLADGAPLGEIAPGTCWETFRLHLPADGAAPGLHWLEIRWSLDLPPADEAIERAAADLEAARPFSLRPVFGEVHTLRARRCSCTARAAGG